MAKPSRNFSKKTLKVLFALSGNQCAHPECTKSIIEAATEKSDSIVSAQICHIYAFSEDGPRGKTGLTKKEINAPGNLILLCCHHHVIVDGQHETYPAEMLKKWKQVHETKMQSLISSDLRSVPSDIFSHPYFPVELVDQKIKEEVDILRKSRFFSEFSADRSSSSLGKRLTEGDLSGGTKSVRSHALAWCARLLSRAEELEKAESYLDSAKVLGDCQEIKIADAFITSQKGDKKNALGILADIDLPISRSAAFMIVAHHEGNERAIEWLEAAGLNATDLDSDGKCFLLCQLLELTRWEEARNVLDAIDERDFEETPTLHHLVALTHLLAAVPDELCATTINHLPFELADFPLAATVDAMAARRTAHGHFVKAMHAAEQLNCEGMAAVNDEYALWLELKDPKEFDEGMQRLKNKLRNLKSAFRFIPFGLQFGIKLDLEKVDQEIDQQIALHGEITPDAAIARFSLVFSQKTPEEVVSYISQHREGLCKYINEGLIRSLEIEVLAKAGLVKKANEYLESLLQENLPDVNESRLRTTIAEAEGIDPIEAQESRFKETGRIGDLASLVNDLKARQQWDSLCKYGEILFERTRSIPDAECLANALSNANKTERLYNILSENIELLKQSENLRLFYCWSLYNRGDFLKARAELEKLLGNLDTSNYRSLYVNVYIALGDWGALTAFVGNEYLKREQRNAHELIKTAELSFHLGLSQTKDLTFAAASKGDEDAQVMAKAYFIATHSGWEDDEEAGQWLHKAVELSEDEGPLRKMKLKDILDLKPEWDHRESETWRLLSCGETPMFLAAQSLNKSLADLMLFPAYANLTKKDPRQRVAIPAYSGKRSSIPFSIGGTVGMDATALFTLSFLNLLDEAFDAFDAVYLPHSTFAWLLYERQNVKFHQPSRIRDSHKIRDLLVSGTLEKLTPNAVADSELSAQVGDELAQFIAEAENGSSDDGSQRLVVQPCPVHRLSSLMEEEADLTEYATVMSSCKSVVAKLRQKGQITSEEERRAYDYLRLHEKLWPDQPEIADRAILYLDDLAVHYFLHLGMLEKIHAAGFKVIVSSRLLNDADDLISYESLSGKTIETLEHLQTAISSRIESGKIKFGKRRNDQSEQRSIFENPIADLFPLVENCDSIISDDRFLNQHGNLSNNSILSPVYTTAELLDSLTINGTITSEHRMELRTQLRRACYFFVPVDDEELTAHLAASTVEDDVVVETAELKAIRENILCVRMSNWLQLPLETPWLANIFVVFARSLKSLWNANVDPTDIMIRSDWIMEQIDIHNWVHYLDLDEASVTLDDLPHKKWTVKMGLRHRY